MEMDIGNKTSDDKADMIIGILYARAERSCRIIRQ